jgi:hypothetical protein
MVHIVELLSGNAKITELNMSWNNGFGDAEIAMLANVLKV